MTPNDWIYNQAARSWEEEDDDPPDQCKECGQYKCICGKAIDKE